MIRALHLVHNTEWQKGLERGYMRADLMCTQTPPPSQCTTEHPIYCPAIVCSALSSIEAKCLGPLNTTLDTIDGQRGAGSWQKWDGDIHIPPINMNTHTYGMQIHIRHTHRCTALYTHLHLLKGTKLAQHEGQTCIQAPTGLDIHEHAAHTHKHTHKNKALNPLGREWREWPQSGSHKRQTQEMGWQKMMLICGGKRYTENDIISSERELPGGTVFFLYVSVAQAVSGRKQQCQVS